MSLSVSFIYFLTSMLLLEGQKSSLTSPFFIWLSFPLSLGLSCGFSSGIAVKSGP